MTRSTPGNGGAVKDIPGLAPQSDGPRTWLEHATEICQFKPYNRLQFPRELVGGLFPVGEDAIWSYHEESGFCVVSNGALPHEGVKRVESGSVGSESDNYRVTVPASFREPEDEDMPNIAAEKAGIPDAARFTKGEHYHFLYPEDAFEREIGWCLIVETSVFERLFLTPPRSVSGLLGEGERSARSSSWT